MNLEGFWRDIYASPFAVSATLVSADGEPPVTVTVIDATKGVNVPDSADPGVMTLRPVAYVRRSDLADNEVCFEDLDGASLTFNGKTWTVTAFGPRPSPVGGEASGDLQLILVQAAIQ